MRYRLLSVFVLFLAVASCAPDQETDSTDSGVVCRIIDPGCGALPSQWIKGDKVALWRSQSRELYRFTGGVDSNQGKFEKVQDGRTGIGSPFNGVYAFYPYSSDVNCIREGVFTFTFPDRQTYVPGGVDRSVCLMAASNRTGFNSPLVFDNACGLLRLDYTGTDFITAIRLRGNRDETICGKATLSIDAHGDQSLTLNGDWKEISVDCGQGIRLTQGVTTSIFISLPPMAFEDGLSVELVTEGMGEYRQVLSGPVEIHRGGCLNIPEIYLPYGHGKDFLGYRLLLPDGRKADAVDVSGDIITVCVPRGTNLGSLVAEFETTAAEVVVGAAKQKSGETANSFSSSSGVKYKLTSLFGESRSYTVKVVDVDLPVIYVSTVGHEAVADKVNWHLGSRFVVVDTDGTMTDYGSTGIRGRGNSSWTYKKKPYAIKFETRPQKQDPAKPALLGMPGHKRWCLLSNCMGYYYGNIVGYEVGRRSTFDWSPHARFVELVLNGEHKGLYTLVEQIKIDKERIDIKPGFLLSFDTTYDETYKFKSTGFTMPVMVKAPDEEDMTPLMFQEIQDYINAMVASLKDDDSFKDRDYLNYLDVDTFIGAWMTKELASRKSNGTGRTTDFETPRSVYYHKDKDGLLKAGPAWDFDVHFLLHEEALFCNKCQYYGRLFQDEQFVRRVKQLWPQFKDNLIGNDRFTGIIQYADSLYNVSAYSAARDYKMWGKWTTSYPQYTAEQQHERMVQMLDARIKWMDKVINDM